jgi:hypothetical protein
MFDNADAVGHGTVGAANRVAIFAMVARLSMHGNLRRSNLILKSLGDR